MTERAEGSGSGQPAPFFVQLEARAKTVDSLLCVGLDPHPELVGSAAPEAARAWCLRLIEATAAVACAFKPNAAFFEALGPAGWEALRDVIQAARLHAPVILDAKRGDIASTGRAYARSIFAELQADAVTLSPYLGRDAVEPFLAHAGRGIFVLCKTSNPGAGEIQDVRLVGGETVYQRVARQAQAWGPAGDLGLVVGATDPVALRSVRDIAASIWILAPGVGPQGGEIEPALNAGLRPDGLGMVLPVARALSLAADPSAEARRLCDEINRHRRQPAPIEGLTGERGMLADALVETGCIQFGEFTLKSGLRSPFYIDLRRVASFPKLLGTVVNAYRAILAGLAFDRLAAIPYGAMAIGGALALDAGWPMVYPRLEVKEHGTRRMVEGAFAPGEVVVVVDDLATTGGSKLDAIERLRDAGLRVTDVVVLVDRQSGAAEALTGAGVRLHSVYTLGELLDHWERSGRIEPGLIEAARRFLRTSPG